RGPQSENGGGHDTVPKGEKSPQPLIQSEQQDQHHEDEHHHPDGLPEGLGEPLLQSKVKPDQERKVVAEDNTDQMKRERTAPPKNQIVSKEGDQFHLQTEKAPFPVPSYRADSGVCPVHVR